MPRRSRADKPAGLFGVAGEWRRLPLRPWPAWRCSSSYRDLRVPLPRPPHGTPQSLSNRGSPPLRPSICRRVAPRRIRGSPPSDPRFVGGWPQDGSEGRPPSDPRFVGGWPQDKSGGQPPSDPRFVGGWPQDRSGGQPPSDPRFARGWPQDNRSATGKRARLVVGERIGEQSPRGERGRRDAQARPSVPVASIAPRAGGFDVFQQTRRRSAARAKLGIPEPVDQSVAPPCHAWRRVRSFPCTKACRTGAMFPATLSSHSSAPIASRGSP